MQFPSRNLTLQYISLSYQDVVQRYAPPAGDSYLLDGLGNVIGYIPTGSVGNSILTSDQTASYSAKSTWAQVADVALIAETAETASYLSGSNAVVGTLTVTGLLNATQISGSQVYVTSSQLTVTDNIITLNAQSPYLRYAGIEMYDSGSGNVASMLWDGEDNHFFVSSSDAGYSRKLILGPDNTGDLTANYIPLATGSNGLINSVIYQSGSSIGIGTTSPIQKLEVSGNIQLSRTPGTLIYGGDNNSAIQFQTTTAAGYLNRAFKFTGGSHGNGLLAVNPDGGGFAVGTINGDRGNGYAIGLNTALTLAGSSPRAFIDVVGTTGGVSMPMVILQSNTASYSGDYLKIMNTSSVVLFDINSSGSVGINTSTPTSKLHISGSSANESLFRVQNSTGTNCLFVTSSGKVGVGTITPSYIVDVSGTGADGSHAIRVKNTSNGSAQTAEFRAENDAGYSARMFKLGSGYGSYKILTSNDIGFYNSGAGHISILNDVTSGNILMSAGASSTAHLMVSASGNVGVNTSSPSARLHVNGDISSSTVRAATGLGVGAAPLASVFLGTTSDRTIAVENTTNLVAGKDLIVKAGQTVNYGTANFSRLNQTQRDWIGLAVAPNGNVYSSVLSGDIYMQTSGAGAFNALGQGSKSWWKLAAAPNGNVYAAAYNDDVYMQTNGTGNFAPLGFGGQSWYSITVAPNGNVYVGVDNGDIYKQTNGSGPLVALGQTSRRWVALTATPTGDIYAAVLSGDIYKQTNGTGNFVALNQTNRVWMSIAASPNGTVYAGVNNGGDIYMQSNGTGDFIALGQPSKNWLGLAAAPNGNVYAASFGEDIYIQYAPVGTSDLAGGNLSLYSGLGKGASVSKISFNTPTPLASGTDLQSTSEKMVLDGYGNLGIGVASPINRLDVSGNISCSVITASLFYGTSSIASNVLTLAPSIKTVAGSYAMTSSDFTVIVTGSISATITLPTTNVSSGRYYIIKNRLAHPLHIATSNGATIDGESSLTSSFKNSAITLQFSGSEWFIM